jgi:hypothetical protein
VTVRRFQDLILIDSRLGSLAGIIAGLAASFFRFGFRWPYWRICNNIATFLWGCRVAVVAAEPGSA